METMETLAWWQKTVFYQIYPRSFADGNGDGIGDLAGMIDRLDYLQDLGIGGIWLSPHYPSPQFDCGYDIADYTGVAPEYGTVDDFKRFLDAAHQRGIRVILDLVLNHTSHRHPWFIESRSSRNNPKRDWYVWHDPAPNGGPPNNWHAAFSDSAWEFDENTGQYYYHFFLVEQPDLNWRNPAVKQAMFDAMRFWLDMGVDGFRIDAIGTVFEDPAMPNHPSDKTPADLFKITLAAYPNEPSQEERNLIREERNHILQYQRDQPGLHDLMKEMRALVDEYEDRVLVGETENLSYHGTNNDELHMVFNFPLMTTPKLTPDAVRANQTERLTAMPAGGWPCNTLGNHDTSRVFSRFTDGKNGDALARLSLALMLTLRGTPFLYNGEEIGMTDWPMTDLAQIKDNVGLWIYNTAVNDLNATPQQAMAVAQEMSRDKCRTPMQWANAANGGFSPQAAQTWLPVNPNYQQGVNVADQLADPDSLLNFYRRMLHIRRQTPALIAGNYQPVNPNATTYLAFLRQTKSQTCLVVLNTSDQAQSIGLDLTADTLTTHFSSNAAQAATVATAALSVAPFEVYIAKV